MAQTYLLLNDETNALKLVGKAQKKFMGNVQYAAEEEYGSIRTDDVNPYFEAPNGDI